MLDYKSAHNQIGQAKKGLQFVNPIITDPLLINWEYSRLLDVHKWSDYPEINKAVQQLFSEMDKYPPACKGKKAQRLRNHIKVIVLDILIAHNQDARLCLAFSLNKNDYGQHSRMEKIHLTYSCISAAMTAFSDLGYILLKKGFKDHETNIGKQSRLYPTPLLVNLFQDQRLSTSMVRRELPEIVLRDKNKKNMKITGKGRTTANRLEKEVKRINTFLDNQIIELPNSPKLTKELINRNIPRPDMARVQLQRIFNENFQRGGRFYGPWYQNIPKEFRAQILINGQPTVELDYSNLHPRMLYALEGLPFDGDAYSLPGYETTLYRPIIKTLLNTLINAKSEQSAIKSLLRTDHEASTSIKVRTYLRRTGLIKPDNKQDIPAAKKMIKAIKERHAPILKHLGTGAGIQLQRKDSSMAKRIIMNLMKESVPCLPVHDSFIVPYQFAEKLLTEMQQAFADKFGLPIDVDVKSVPQGFEYLRDVIDTAKSQDLFIYSNALNANFLSNGIRDVLGGVMETDFRENGRAEQENGQEKFKLHFSADPDNSQKREAGQC